MIMMELRWHANVKIMKACIHLPAGVSLYKLTQKALGRLKNDPMSRVAVLVVMARWLMGAGLDMERLRF